MVLEKVGTLLLHEYGFAKSERIKRKVYELSYNKTMKKIVSMLLVVVMLFSFVACVIPEDLPPETTPKATSAPKTNVSSSEEQTTEPETTQSQHAPNNLPSLTFNGEDFRIMANAAIGDNAARDIVFLEDVLTNSINEAVRDRNDYIEDTYDVKIKAAWAESADDTLAKSRSAHKTNLVLCEFVSTNYNNFGIMIQEGLLVDLNSLKYTDLSQPYWNQNCRNNMSIAHKLFFESGDLLTTDKEGTWSIAFNRDLVNNNPTLRSLYDIVDEGGWTYDVMYQYMKAVCDYESHDPNDQFGITWGSATEPGNTYKMWQGAGTQLIVKDPITDLPMLGEFTDASFNSMILVGNVQYDKTVAILQQDIKNLPAGGGNFEGIIKLFQIGKALFKVGSMSVVEWMRDHDADFGVLPMPKYNEEQKEYFSSQSESFAYAIGMPSVLPVDRRDFASFVIEALCCESTATVLEGYYDKTLKYKGLRKEEDERMLDLVFKNRMYDLTLVFDWAGSLVSDIGNVKTQKQATSIKNKYDKYKGSVEKAINSFLTKNGFI